MNLLICAGFIVMKLLLLLLSLNENKYSIKNILYFCKIQQQFSTKFFFELFPCIFVFIFCADECAIVVNQQENVTSRTTKNTSHCSNTSIKCENFMLCILEECNTCTYVQMFLMLEHRPMRLNFGLEFFFAFCRLLLIWRNFLLFGFLNFTGKFLEITE